MSTRLLRTEHYNSNPDSVLRTCTQPDSNEGMQPTPDQFGLELAEIVAIKKAQQTYDSREASLKSNCFKACFGLGAIWIVFSAPWFSLPAIPADGVLSKEFFLRFTMFFFIILGPSVIFVGVLGAFGGYFLGELLTRCLGLKPPQSIRSKLNLIEKYEDALANWHQSQRDKDIEVVLGLAAYLENLKQYSPTDFPTGDHLPYPRNRIQIALTRLSNATDIPPDLKEAARLAQEFILERKPE